MTRSKRNILLFACLSILPVCPVAARAATKAIYVPTSGWLVGPASLSPAAGTRLPCIMMNQYDNGYTFRFSGGNKRILAAAIDFKQSVFTAGTSYPLTLEIPPSFSKQVDGVAYNETILMVTAGDPQQAGDLYKAIAGGQQLRLSLGPQTVDFALVGAGDGLRRVEACYDPEVPQRKEWSAAKADTDGPDKMMAVPVPEVPSIPVIDPDPQSHAAAMPADDTQLAKAAAQALANPAAAPKAAPVADAAAGVSSPPAAPPVTAGAPQNWQAARGAGLRDILEFWSKRGNVRLSWAATHTYPVKETLNVSGSFEQAVQSLLAQFDSEKSRPVARFYVDTSDKKPVLLIREEGT